MVANITSGASIYGVLLYNKEKIRAGEAKVILCNGMLHTPQIMLTGDIGLAMKTFRPYLNANRRTIYPVFHVSLSPHPDDDQSEERLQEIAREYMDGMGYGDQPYIAYLHEDIERRHIHIVSLRINRKGAKLPHDFEGRDISMPLLRRLEQKYGLIPAVKGEHLPDLYAVSQVNYRSGNIRQQISTIVKNLVRDYRFQSLGELNTLLGLLNVSVNEVKTEHDGKPVSGIIYSALDSEGRKVGKPIKSSDIDRRVGHAALEDKFSRSKDHFKKYPRKLDSIRQRVRSAMQGSGTIESFATIAEASGIQTVFRYSAEGRITGVTFLDHDKRIVINGRPLGKEFAANAFHEKYGPRPQTDSSQQSSLRKGYTYSQSNREHTSIKAPPHTMNEEPTYDWLDFLWEGLDAVSGPGVDDRDQEAWLRRKRRQKQQ